MNILMLYIGFSLIFTYLYKKVHKVWAFIIALLLVCNPIAVGQVFNYYIDGLLANTLFLIICSLIAITEYITDKERKLEKDCQFEIKEYFAILAYAIIIIVNLKFTGLVYAGIFCFLFYLYWLYIGYKEGNLKEKLIKYTSFYFVTVMIATTIVGYSSYVKNFIEKGHPFYPLFGNEKVDIITHNQPKYFKERNFLQKFMITMFSEGSNIHDSYGDNNEKPHFKMPFTIRKDEIKEYARPDTRISGFGPLYSGIFILSSIATLYMLIIGVKEKRYNKLIPFLLLLIGILFLIIATDGSWWARYTPYLYLLPIFNSVFLLNQKSKIEKVLAILIILLLTVNVAMIMYANCSLHIKQYSKIEDALNTFEKYVNSHENVKVSLKNRGFEGIKFNISDLDIDINKIEYVKKIKSKKKNVYFFAYNLE